MNWNYTSEPRTTTNNLELNLEQSSTSPVCFWSGPTKLNREDGWGFTYVGTIQWIGYGSCLHQTICDTEQLLCMHCQYHQSGSREGSITDLGNHDGSLVYL